VVHTRDILATADTAFDGSYTFKCPRYAGDSRKPVVSESGVGGRENIKHKPNTFGATSATALQNATTENKPDYLNVMQKRYTSRNIEFIVVTYLRCASEQVKTCGTGRGSIPRFRDSSTLCSAVREDFVFQKLLSDDNSLQKPSRMKTNLIPVYFLFGLKASNL
jgi:hypothetical protein